MGRIINNQNLLPVQGSFKVENFPGSTNGQIVNYDLPGKFPEEQLDLPWIIDPYTSYLEYRAWVEVVLDAGLALHKPLPQQDDPIDTLASVFFADDFVSADYGTSTTGVNMAEQSQAQDVIQRMATSEYRFILHGWGLRAGYQIPIPGLISVGRAPCIPEGEQRAYNTLAGNLCGVPLWLAAWRLPYVIIQPMSRGTAKAPVPPNPALRIRSDIKLPLAFTLPRTQTDSNSTQNQQPG